MKKKSILFAFVFMIVGLFGMAFAGGPPPDDSPFEKDGTGVKTLDSITHVAIGGELQLTGPLEGSFIPRIEDLEDLVDIVLEPGEVASGVADYRNNKPSLYVGGDDGGKRVLAGAQRFKEKPLFNAQYKTVSLGVVGCGGIAFNGEFLVFEAIAAQMYVSKDGENWTTISNPVAALVPIVVYNGTLFAYDSTNDLLYLTQDIRGDWESRSLTTTLRLPGTVIDGRILCVSSATHFAYSDDGGLTWGTIEHSLTDDTTTTGTEFLYVDDKIFIKTDEYDSFAYSDDKGDTWTGGTISVPDGYDYISYPQLSSLGGTLYASVRASITSPESHVPFFSKSTNSGSTWTHTTWESLIPEQTLSATAMLIRAHDGVLLTGGSFSSVGMFTGYLFYTSIDGGDLWSEVYYKDYDFTINNNYDTWLEANGMLLNIEAVGSLPTRVLVCGNPAQGRDVIEEKQLVPTTKKIAGNWEFLLQDGGLVLKNSDDECAKVYLNDTQDGFEFDTITCP